MSMCRVFSCVVGRGCLQWPVHSLGKTLLAFPLLHSVFQGQICLLLQVFLGFLLLHSSPLWWKGHLFWVLVLKGLVGLHRTIQLQLLQRYWLGHRLGLLWSEWKSSKSKKVGSQETPGVNRQIWPWNTEWSRGKTNRVLPRKCTSHSKHSLPTTQEKTLHMDITRWSTPKSDWLYSLQPKMEKLYTVSKNKTRSWLWLRPWTPYCQIQT